MGPLSLRRALRRLLRRGADRLGPLVRKSSQLSRHVLVWLVLMTGAAWLVDSLKPLDWALVNALDQGTTPWPANVELIDIGWNQDPRTVEQVRRDVAAAMQALAELERPPRVVVIDISMSRVPLGLEPLKAAAQSLDDARIQLIAVADREAFSPVLAFGEVLKRQGNDRTAYAGFALFGHTAFEFDGNAYWYRPCLSVPSLDRLPPCLAAIPYMVGEKIARPDVTIQEPSKDDLPVLFHPGDPDAWREKVWRLRDGKLVPAGAGSQPREMRPAVVILGNLQSDLVNCRPPVGTKDLESVLDHCRRGPELLAWAIGANIAPSPPHAPRQVTLTRARWTIGFAVGFSLIALVVFARVRRAMSYPEHHLVALSVMSIVLTLAALAACVALLRYGMHVVFVPVSFVAVAVVVTVGMAWYTLREQLRERALYTTVERPPGSEEREYDVFISYSHTPAENMEWVRREVYEPLSRASLNGRPLRVFFDTRSIRIGTNWYFEIAYGIQCSRCVVAIYSSDYFSKSFCNFELTKAVTRDIADQRVHFCIVPLKRRNLKAVPDAFSHIQFEEITDQAATVEAVLSSLKRLRDPREAPSSPT